jgi:hypothetical protein
VDPVAAIADAVLYEGYLLWPYRRTATKNQRRWTFGGVYPPRHSAGHPDDPAAMQTQCLVEGGHGCRVEVRVRFLHVVRRDLARAVGGTLEPVDELVVGGERHVAWEEAVEREAGAAGLALGDLAEPRRLPIDVPAGAAEEELRDAGGARAGAFVRSWRALRGTVEIGAEQLAPELHRLTVRIENETEVGPGTREQAVRQAFCSTHTVLRAERGAFVSLTDPPAALHAHAEGCENTGTWPVLVGAEGERGTMLSSPIILPDHPEIAPESPGDLFDASEIDQLLTLSILSMTDEERREMRAADPKAREILERTEALSGEELMRMHGTIRELGLRRR